MDRVRSAGQVSWAFVGIAVLVGVIGAICWTLRVIFPPLILAASIVFVLNPIVTRLAHRGAPRVVGAAAAYLLVLAVLALAVLIVVPLATDQGRQLADDWPSIRAKGERWIDARAVDSQGTIFEFTRSDLEDAFSSPDLSFRQQLDRAQRLGLKVFHVLLILFLGPVIAFYLLVDLPAIRRTAESLVPASARGEVLHVSGRLNRAIGGFFRGQLLVALIVGVLCSIGLFAIGLKFWFLIGMIAGICNVIPLIGPFLGGIPGVIIAITTGSPLQALLVVAIMTGAQQIDNHFITPQVMHRAVHLHPAAVVLALLAGGTVGGFIGLLLAVPITAAVKIILSHLWRVHVLGEPWQAVAAVEDAQDDVPGAGAPPATPAAPGALDPAK